MILYGTSGPDKVSSFPLDLTLFPIFLGPSLSPEPPCPLSLEWPMKSPRPRPWSRDSPGSLTPGPIKRHIISRFPVCFPPSPRVIVLRILRLWWYFPVSVPSLQQCLPSPLLPFKFELVETKLKSPGSPPFFLQTSVSAGVWEMGTWAKLFRARENEKKLRHSSSISREGIVVWSPEETEYYVCSPGERFITFARLEIALGPGLALLTAIFLLPDFKIINVQKYLQPECWVYFCQV